MQSIINLQNTSAQIITATDNIWKLLGTVYDPEIPVLSVLDLGIVRTVKYIPALLPAAEGQWELCITPTYCGCPAIDMITLNIRLVLVEHGYTNIKIMAVLSPAWTTDWITEAGKQKLKAYGIAPPQAQQPVCCPQCRSSNTQLLSQFGSTACKALYQCTNCKEPFDYFKCH